MGAAVSSIMAMQSTGHGAMHSSHPVHNAVITVWVKRAAPTMASTGHGGRHFAQPIATRLVDECHPRRRLYNRFVGSAAAVRDEAVAPARVSSPRLPAGTG